MNSARIMKRVNAEAAREATGMPRVNISVEKIRRTAPRGTQDINALSEHLYSSLVTVSHEDSSSFCIWSCAFFSASLPTGRGP